jgi:hypothetical protein
MEEFVMATKPSPSKRSSNPKTTRKAQPHVRNANPDTPARMHRNETAEAKQQRAGLPKTHPNSAGRQAAARKDK